MLGSEEADQAAKDALSAVDFRKIAVPWPDIKQYSNKHVLAYGNPLGIYPYTTNSTHSSQLLVSGYQATDVPERIGGLWWMICYYPTRPCKQCDQEQFPRWPTQ